MRKHVIRDFALISGFVSTVWLAFWLLAGDRIWQAWHAETGAIAWVMAFGSFIAGSTCLGGGAVAFPALTKFMGVDPFTAKSFSLAIQSAGMTSASLFILLTIRKLPWRFISIYLLNSFIGLLISLAWLDNALSPADIRIGFTLFSLSFLVVFILANQKEAFIHENIDAHTWHGQSMIAAFGIVGGVASGLLGSGADLLAFSALAIYFRLNIRIATQISVLTMAANSLVGVAFQHFALDEIPPQTATLWFAAAPIVIAGAPIGALVCKYISQKLLFALVIVLVSLEVLTTLWLIPIEITKIKYYAMIFVVALVGLFLGHWFPHKHQTSP